MDSTWTEAFYQETDAMKRLELLKQNTVEESPEDAFRKKLWISRYGKRKPRKDAFVGCFMELKYLAEGSSLDVGGTRRKQAAKILGTLYLAGAEELPQEEQEILVAELKNAFLKFMEVSAGGRGFTSLVFGMGQLSDEGVVKKIAEQVSNIAFQAPHSLRMEREFALLKRAALEAFRQEYPDREHFLRK